MLMDDSLLFSKAMELHNSSSTAIHWKWSGEFVIGNKIISINKVISIDTVSEYVTATSDYIYVTVDVYKSTYKELIRYGKTGIKFRLVKRGTNVSGDNEITGPAYINLYDAYPTNSNSIDMSQGNGNNDYRDDISNTLEMTLQLIEPGLSEFRLKEVSGVYNGINRKGVSTSEIIKHLMSTDIVALGKGKGYPVSMVTGENTIERYQLVIPNGTKLIDIPKYIQDSYGVYSTGIGYYLSRGQWYIYPLYDLNRYDKTEKTITLFNLPKDDPIGTTKTYVKSGNSIFIFATGDSLHIDNSNSNLDKTGTGLRVANSGNVTGNFVKTEKGLTKVRADKNKIEFEFNKDGDPKTELKNLKSSKRFTNNIWRDVSDIKRESSSVLVVTWESSNPNLITPGIPIKYLYKRNGKLVSSLGTLVSIVSKSSTDKISYSDNRYVSNSVLTIVLSRID